MTESTKSLPEFKHRAIARVYPRDSDTVSVFVDAWDYAIVIPVAISDLPADVVQALNDNQPLIAAEVRANLGADRAKDVIGEIVKRLEIPSDEEMESFFE